MGLDMHLEAIKKNGEPFKKVVEEFNALDFETWIKTKIELAYWRKANQIHKWFVDNVQNGIDDCESYELTKDVVNQLLQVCYKVKSVFDSATKIKGKVKSGQRWTNKGWEDIFVDGDVYLNLDTKLIEELLPTEKGFFFGSTEIDGWYFKDIENTISQLEKTLNEISFDEYHVYYTSSW